MEPDRLERSVALVRALLPAAKTTPTTPHTVTFESGGTRGIVVMVAGDAVDIRLPTTEWDGHTPVVTTRPWRTILHEQADRATLRKLLAEARRERRNEFHHCQFCGRSVPVEHRYDDLTCHGCASKHFGVVY